MANFIILIGGPGTFESCDPAHDKIWLNYSYPVQIAAEKNLYQRGTDKVYWVVYEPAYRNRWLDDSEVTFLETAREVFSGRALHNIRKKAADDVVFAGATNYLDRINSLARQFGITYKGISQPDEFWTCLASFPPKSISRVWYFGHATMAGLILLLTHNSACDATREDSSTVLTEEISRHALRELPSDYFPRDGKDSVLKAFGGSPEKSIDEGVRLL